MLVTDIIPVNKSKYKIVTDNGIAFVLYKGDLSRYRIRVNEELDDAAWDNLIHSILPSRCYNRALGIFKTKDYTEREIRIKLSKEGYLNEIIDMTIERLVSERFIDDYRYASGYIRDKSKKLSLMTIRNNLRMKGISSDIYESAMAEVIADGDLSDETDTIIKIINKRKYNPETASFEDTQKLIRYLLSKGFSFDSINKVVKKSDIGYN